MSTTHQITLASGRSFSCETGESLLDAALRSGVALAYSCRTGRCSTCMCKISAGTAVALYDEQGLSDAEKAEGWVLSCVRTPTSDATLDVDDFAGVELPKAWTLPCRIQSLERMAPDVVRVVLRLPPNGVLSFLPGQYVDIIGPNGIRRSYSLANANAEEKRFELHIRAVAGGQFSAYWFEQAKENDLLRLHGPLGTFFLRTLAGKDLIFLATGTGIAPVKAMLEGLQTFSPEERPASVTVYWGGRHSEDLYWDPATVQGAHRFVPVLSRPGSQWQGASGYVQQILLGERHDFSNAVVYACGSDLMIRSAKKALEGAGLPAREFFSDAFVSSEHA